MGTLSFDKTSESPVVDLGFPIGGVDLFGGVDLQRGHFLVKIYEKTKELGPVVGGACAGHAPLDRPMKSIQIQVQKIELLFH